MLLDSLIKKKLLQPGTNVPKWLAPNCSYLVQMGSEAYGCSSNESDIDVYGFAIAPREVTFPHLAGNISGFGPQPETFDQWQLHHLKSPDNGREYDFSIYNIVKFFHLVAENNPNMLDALFTPQRCVLHCTAVGQMVRDRRKEFVHKGSYHKFRGYAYAQLNKIKNKTNSTNPKRAASIAQHGFDVKFAYHIVRLALEAEQLLTYGEMDIERDREILKSVRRGEWTLERIESWFAAKEPELEKLYSSSAIQHSPDLLKLRQLLLDCLEHHYGNLDTVIARDISHEAMIRDLETVIARYKPRA